MSRDRIASATVGRKRWGPSRAIKGRTPSAAVAAKVHTMPLPTRDVVQKKTGSYQTIHDPKKS
jgi:hypothetical protein